MYSTISSARSLSWRASSDSAAQVAAARSPSGSLRPMPGASAGSKPSRSMVRPNPSVPRVAIASPSASAASMPRRFTSVHLDDAHAEPAQQRHLAILVGAHADIADMLRPQHAAAELEERAVAMAEQRRRAHAVRVHRRRRLRRVRVEMRVEPDQAERRIGRGRARRRPSCPWRSRGRRPAPPGSACAAMARATSSASAAAWRATRPKVSGGAGAGMRRANASRCAPWRATRRRGRAARSASARPRCAQRRRSFLGVAEAGAPSRCGADQCDLCHLAQPWWRKTLRPAMTVRSTWPWTGRPS